LRVLDYIGLGFLLLVPEEIWRNPKGWYSWGAALVIGVVFLWLGDAIPIAWKWLLREWPWGQLRIAKAENLELRKRLDTPKELVTLPAPAQGRLVKPPHNVQFAGFNLLHWEAFGLACLHFQNAPTAGKLLGKFNHPRLRVIYYEHSTGQEIDDFYSVPWHDKDEGIEDISAAGRDAQIAWFFDKWKAIEGSERPLTSLSFDEDNIPADEPRSIDLPSGKIRIVAILSGNYVDSPVLTVTGILTLGDNGSASFSKDI
jgi:hypothetical protein